MKLVKNKVGNTGIEPFSEIYTEDKVWISCRTITTELIWVNIARHIDAKERSEVHNEISLHEIIQARNNYIEKSGQLPAKPKQILIPVFDLTWTFVGLQIHLKLFDEIFKKEKNEVGQR